MARATVKPTPPPRSPALVRRRVAIGTIGAGAIAAGLAVACGGKTTAAGDGTTDGTVAPQPYDECAVSGRHCKPPQEETMPQPPPPQPPQRPPPQPPQPFDAGGFDAEDQG